MNEINLFAFAERLAAVSGSLYKGTRYDKARLTEFMAANDWFGTIPTKRDNVPHITLPASDGVRKLLELWLSAFKQPDNMKLELLLRHFESEYPKTCELYREFVVSECLENEAYSWKLLDFMFDGIGKEITDCGEQEIESFIQMLDAEGSLAAAKMFARFLRFSELTEWDYGFGPRGGPDVSNGAYPLRDFAVMAYCVFNGEMWERQQLIEKAAGSRQYSDLWLYTALHFVCALRGADMARLPAPQLPYEPKRVLNEISCGTFPERSAAALTDELTFRLNMKGMTPSKTEAFRNVPHVKLFIPESLRVPLGTIIAIALAQRHDVKPGGRFVFPADYRRAYERFFGTEFAKVMGRRQLSVRRCNKSYLQGIEAVADAGDTPGKPKGYMLAALARSHKGGIGTLPEITEIYLKDANFTGYSPEFIAREMFERGVFSFIPATLLEIYAGNDFKRLPVRSQTLLIQTVGLRPSQIENLLTAAESALGKARSTVAELVRGFGMNRADIGGTLQNIASGNAPSRTRECLCLMSAVDRQCPHPERAGCVGCGYEILTKSAMRLLMKEFERLKAARASSGETERWRYSKLMAHAVLPAISEIIACAKSLAPGEDISPLLEIIETGRKQHDRFA